MYFLKQIPFPINGQKELVVSRIIFMLNFRGLEFRGPYYQREGIFKGSRLLNNFVGKLCLLSTKFVYRKVMGIPLGKDVAGKMDLGLL